MKNENNKLIMGAAQEKITPEVGCLLCGYVLDLTSKSVNDDLTATAYYFSQGGVESIMVSLTVCVITEDIAWTIRKMIEDKTGVPAENVLLHATHTHSGPVTGNVVGFGVADMKYIDEIFVPGILKASADAKATAEPVSMAVATGNSYVAVNRRELTEDNEVKLGQNPWGALDPTMTVISFKNDAGVIKGTMIHYGCHGTAAGRSVEITRDWSGVMVDAVSRYGGGICAFFGGPEGDVGPRLMNGQTTAGEEPKNILGEVGIAIEHGGYAAQDALRIFKNTLHYSSDVTLEVSSSIIELPVDPRPALEFAKEEYEKYKQYTVNYLGAYASHLRDVIKSYEEGYEEKTHRELQQTIVRIGDVAFVSFSYELFAEIGLRIKKHSPIPFTLSLSNTQGTDGYFPAESDICRGGYEVTMFKMKYIQPIANNGDIHLIKGTLEHLRSLGK